MIIDQKQHIITWTQFITEMLKMCYFGAVGRRPDTQEVMGSSPSACKHFGHTPMYTYEMLRWHTYKDDSAVWGPLIT